MLLSLFMLKYRFWRNVVVLTMLTGSANSSISSNVDPLVTLWHLSPSNEPACNVNFTSWFKIVLKNFTFNPDSFLGQKETITSLKRTTIYRRWTAPEVLATLRHWLKSDVWSYGRCPMSLHSLPLFLIRRKIIMSLLKKDIYIFIFRIQMYADDT